MPRLCYPAKSSADVRIDTKLASRPWGRWAAYGWFVAAGRALLRLAARLAGVGPKMSGPEPRLSDHARCLCRGSGLGRYRELPGCDTPFSAGRYALAVCMFLTLAPQALPAATGYLVPNLVADAASTASPAADFIDPRLVNPWGLAASATSPFWVCDGGTGLPTIYTVNATNATALGTPTATTQPTVPGAGGDPKGVCTGLVSNAAPATTPPTAKTDHFAVELTPTALSAWRSFR